MIAATALGLAGVLTFHTSPAHLTLGALPATTPRGTNAMSPTTAPTSTPVSAGAGPPSTSGTTTTAPPSIRTATGEAVNYNYGILSVTVRTSGKRITHVGIGSLDDGGNFRSQSIDQQSIPMLEQQALQAQNAQIQGVSGASYTSAGFAQSLQSALHKLGL